MPSAGRRPSWSCSLPGRLSSWFRTATSWRASTGFRIPLAARRGRRLPLRPQRAARDRPRDGCPADAGGVPARDRARPPPDARGAGQHRDPLVHRLRAARGASGPFEPGADPSAPGRCAVPADPDASLAASSRSRRPEPSCKQHTAVDDENGVVLDVAAATGEVNEGDLIEAQVDEVRRISGKRIGTVTADAGCACGKACGGLERRGIDPAVPAKRLPAGSRVPTRRFRCDERNDIVKCPRGKALRPGRPFKDGRRRFHAGSRDCAGCPPGGDCVSGSRSRKAVEIGADHPALLRARRRRLRWSEEDRRLCRRHRWRSEGFRGEAKTWHGLGRAARRGLGNMRIQSCPAAAAINLKRLAAAFCARFPAVGTIQMRGTPLSALPARRFGPNRPMRIHFSRLRAANPRVGRCRVASRSLRKAA